MRLPDALLPRTAAPDRARLVAARRARLRRLRRLAWRWRYAAAALCCGLAATTTVQLLRPPPPPTVDVVVTARAVLAGAELSADDVVTRPVARSLAPEHAVRSVSGVLGRVAAVGLPAGMPLLAGLVSDGVASSVPPGTVVGPVRLADAAVGGLLRPGDRVDLLTAGPLAGSACSAGEAAEQTVPHLHLHVVPRWTDDDFGHIWPPQTELPEDLKRDAATRIRAAWNSE